MIEKDPNLCLLVASCGVGITIANAFPHLESDPRSTALSVPIPLIIIQQSNNVTHKLSERGWHQSVTTQSESFFI